MRDKGRNTGALMTTDSKEHLSELMDGEIGGDTGRFVLRRLEASGELRAAWARYHLIRDCMRYQDRGFAGDGLSARVRRAIDKPSTDMDEAATPSERRWLRPVAGLAVAATVAMMAIVAVGPSLSTAPQGDEQQLAGQEAQPFTSPNILTRAPVTRQVNLNGGNQDAGTSKMNSYLLRHDQVAGSSGGNGFVPFVPIVISKSATQPGAQADDEVAERAADGSASQQP